MNDARYWLALLHAPGLGARGARQLLEQFASPQALFEANLRDAKVRAALKPQTQDYFAKPDWDTVEKDLAWLNVSEKNRILTLHDTLYPALLKEIPDPPLVLFVHGDANVLQRTHFAVVGSRNPTPNGEQNAHEFARALAQAGWVIASGLALGIDAASHRGALEGGGLTLAVTGTGLDRVYPRRHHVLAHQIAECGALISEFPPGTPPLRENFPRRNRIISGLAIGTLVVEASVNSGSLITARLATEQGREVFAIPGSIHNPLARGCHALIRQGAKLVETAQDIFEELQQYSLPSPVASAVEKSPTTPNVLSHEQNIVMEQLGHEPASIDRLVEYTRLTTDAVSSILLVLELQGHVASSAGLYYRVGPNRRER